MGKTGFKKAVDIFITILLVLICIGLIIVLKTHTIEGYEELNIILIIYTFLVTSFQLSRFFAAWLYPYMKKDYFVPTNGAENQYEPIVSFVIPCKNEEAAIEKTISNCFDLEYSPNKIDVIVINDGSTDKTGETLAALKNKFKKRITVINFEENKGKRKAMYAGFKKAKGEIIMQLDSDSYLEKTSLRKMVAPFQNKEIGATCAHAVPANSEKNWITKMQTVYYFLSFRIFKAAESTFAAVLCCSGCASAYRKTYILPHLDEWVNEKFLGLPVTWGDDRGLTNKLVKNKIKTIYLNDAIVYTFAPESLKKFLLQQIRWKKGWLVNSIFASRFMLQTSPFIALTYFFPLMLITILTPIIATKILIINPIFLGRSPFYYLVGVFLVACLTVIFYRHLDKQHKYWPYVFLWSSINVLILSFILFYASLTIQNRKWSTR
jgi:hyaluronan synthase